MVWLRAWIVWLYLIGAEVIHGTLRTFWLAPVIGDFRARQVSVFTGSIIILAIAFLSIRWIGLRKNGSLILVGLMWLCLTLTFEIGLGRYVFGYSWGRLGSDFNILEGGLLPFGLLVLVFSPLIAAALRGIK
jgi:hypothetical protein